jgi:predicted transposase YbfD/YdcC
MIYYSYSLWEGNMTVTDEEITKLKDSFAGVPDERRQWGNLRHKLIDILVIAFTAILCGRKDYGEMEEYGKFRHDFFKGFLELPNGIPDELTFGRVFRWLKPKALGAALRGWLISIEKADGRVINIDGKTIRGSAGGDGQKARHILSAFVAANGLAIGQVKTEEKSNEITAIPELLDSIDIENSVITADAMGCQKKIAAMIVKKNADYVLAVKENHPALHKDIKEYFEWHDTAAEARDDGVEFFEMGYDGGHGRIERRQIWAAKDVKWLLPSEKWAGLKRIIRYRCFREIKGKRSVEDHYYISSLEESAERLGEIIRGHWAIENNLHWMLDFIYDEDGCRVRKGHAPENLNIMRKLALAKIKTAGPDSKLSVKKRMFKALVDENYLRLLLFGE